MKKILLIEDEVGVVSFIKKGLEEIGYEISVAFDGSTALSMVKNNEFDLLILDIMLPDINGLEVCKKVRETDKIIPILFLTVLGSSENIVVGLKSGRTAESLLYARMRASLSIMRLKCFRIQAASFTWDM